MQPEISQDFKDYAFRLLGRERYGRFSRALAEGPSVSVRLNPFKAGLPGWDGGRLDGADAPVPWADGWGYYLASRPSFASDPLWHAGGYYVQEASSMFLGQVLRQYVDRPVVALDLCAAPGGKSTHLRSCLPGGSLLVSNEPVRARAQVLLENLTKWGHPDVVVTQSYPQDFSALPHVFDLLVADVPCSGEGMFRKEEEAVAGWSMEQVMMCRDRQRAILEDVWPALKPGGLLVYSTCTLNAYEDEENVAWIAGTLGAEVLPVEVDDAWGATGNLCGDRSFPAYHFIPGLARGEGFFLAVLRKAGEEEASDAGAIGKERRRGGKKKDLGRPSGMALPKECQSWLSHPDEFEFRQEGGAWSAVRRGFGSLVGRLREAVNVWQAGIPVAVLKGKDWQPSPALALSVELDASRFPVCAVSYETAVAFLRKETLVLPAELPEGDVLLAFRDVPVGFVKNIGGRANNLYPAEWKIRSSRLPEYTLGWNPA